MDDANLKFPVRSSSYVTGNYFQIGSNDYRVERGMLVVMEPGIVSQWNGGTYAPTDGLMFTEEHLKPFFRNSFLDMN